MSLTVNGILDSVQSVLRGEPARVIGYGGAVVVYLVARVSGSIPDVPLDTAIVQATAAIAVVASFVETIRRLVYSPATVAAIVATPPTAAGPINAAVEAGVPAETVAKELTSL